MEIHDRIKDLRKKYLHLSQSEFGKKLGVSRDVISNIEQGRLARPEHKEPLYKLISNQFNVNEEWLRTGEGEMFKEYDDEVAESVEELLTEDTPFYDIIKGIMITYKKLNPDSRIVIDNFIKQAYDTMKNEDN